MTYVDATVVMIFLASLNPQSFKYSVRIPTTVSNTQGVSGGIGNTLGGGSMDYSE